MLDPLILCVLSAFFAKKPSIHSYKNVTKHQKNQLKTLIMQRFKATIMAYD